MDHALAAQTFPNEIFDRILDHLHDSPSTLRVCGLVLSSWLRTSRLHLFNERHLLLASKDGITNIVKLLLGRPTLRVNWISGLDKHTPLI